MYDAGRKAGDPEIEKVLMTLISIPNTKPLVRKMKMLQEDY